MRLLLAFLAVWALMLGESRRPSPPAHFLDDQGRQWTIALVTPKDMPSCDGGCTFTGYTVESQFTVEVQQGQPLAEEQKTIEHELLHVLLGTDHGADRPTVHGFIYQLAPKLQKVIVANPELMTYLQAK